MDRDRRPLADTPPTSRLTTRARCRCIVLACSLLCLVWAGTLPAAAGSRARLQEELRSTLEAAARAESERLAALSRLERDDASLAVLLAREGFLTDENAVSASALLEANARNHELLRLPPSHYGTSTSAVAWSPDGSRLAVATEEGVYIILLGDSGLGFRHVSTLAAVGVAWSASSELLTAWTSWRQGEDRRTLVLDASDVALSAPAQIDVLAGLNTPRGPIGHHGVASFDGLAVLGPDGERVAVATNDGDIELTTLSGGPRRSIGRFEGDAIALLWNPDGTQVLVRTNGGRQVTLASIEPDASAVLTCPESLRAASFSGSGDRVVTGCEDGRVRMWDRDGNGLGELHLRHPVWNVRWNPRADEILVEWDGGAGVWTPGAPSFFELTELEGHDRSPAQAAWTPDGSRIVTAGADGTVRIYGSDADLLHEIPLAPGGDFRGIAAGGLGLVAAHTRSGLWILWPGQGGHTALPAWTLDHAVAGSLWSPDGLTLAVPSQGRDDTISLWTRGGAPVRDLRLSGRARAVAWSPTEPLLATADESGVVLVWTKQGEQRFAVQAGDAVLGWSPDGSRLATASLEHAVRILGVDGTVVAELEGQGAAVRSVAWSSASDRLGVLHADGRARVWSASGEMLAVLGEEWRPGGRFPQIVTAAFSPDGDRIVTGSGDGLVQAWSRSGEELARLEGHDDSVTAVSFSADGEHVLTTSRDHTARIWSAAGDAVLALGSHDDLVTDAAFSPGGDRVATVSDDGRARVRTLAGEELLAFHLGGRGRSVAWSPRGKDLLTVDERGTHRLWPMERDEWLTRSEWTAEVWPHYPHWAGASRMEIELRTLSDAELEVYRVERSREIRRRREAREALATGEPRLPRRHWRH